MMSAVMKLVQGTPEWHAHRANFRNASETAAVLGLSPWVTPYQLWLQRTGRVTPEVTPAMAYGTRMEPLARTAYEALTRSVIQPLVLVEGDYSASLDGMSFDGSLIVEIKCPYTGRQSELWKTVEKGVIPEHYGWQIEHQLMVSGASLAHLYVFDGTQGLLLEVLPRQDRWKTIQEAWNSFMHYVESDTPPPLTDRDKVIRTDAEWQAAAEVYLELKREADRLSGLLDEVKGKLVELTSHASESGYGVTVTRFWKQGAIDYKAIPQLIGIDIERYRQKGRWETRIGLAR